MQENTSVREKKKKLEATEGVGHVPNVRNQTLDVFYNYYACYLCFLKSKGFTDSVNPSTSPQNCTFCDIFTHGVKLVTCGVETDFLEQDSKHLIRMSGLHCLLWYILKIDRLFSHNYNFTQKLFLPLIIFVLKANSHLLSCH